MIFHKVRHQAFLILVVLLFSNLVSAQEENLGFIELRVNARPDIPVFQTYLTEKEVPYLNFNDLMHALEIPVDFVPAIGRASGFLADGRTRFILNVKYRTVVVGDITHPLEKNAFLVINQKLYVLYSEIGKWFPVKAVWDLEAYRVIVITGYPLPSDESEKRSLKRKSLAEQKKQEFSPEELEREIPWFDPGMFEIRIAASGGHGHPDGALTNLRGVHRFLKGDLEYSLTQSYFDGEARGGRVDYARLTYYDPLRTWQMQFGDTFTSFSPLVLSTVPFRGGSFFTGGKQLRFGRTTLIGTAPPGSEVDLYRLGILVAFTQADEKGFYTFENLPLTIVKTLFEARIFTPNGRRFSNFHDVLSQDEMLPTGKFASIGGAGEGQQGVGKFEVGGSEVRYGLTDWLTLGGYALKLRNYQVSYDLIDEQTTGGLFLLVRPLNWLVLMTEQAMGMEQDGEATRWDAQLGFRALSLELDLRSFAGDYAPPNRTRSESFSQNDLADDIFIAEARARVYSTNLNVKRIATDFGQTRQSHENQLRADRRLFRYFTLVLTLKNERLEEQGFATSGFDSQEVLGFYQFNPLSRVETLLRKTRVLNSVDTTQARLTVSKNQRLDSPWFYRVSYSSFSDQENFYQASMGYMIAKNFRASAEVDSQDKWLVRLEYSLPFRVTGKGLKSFPAESYGRAGLSGIVFLDQNGNGIYDPGEPPAADVRVLAPGIRNLVSDQDGIVEGWGLPTHEPSRISLDLHSTDALFAPVRESQPIAPRPGELVRMNFPLVSLGGLEGVLTGDEPKGVSPVNGLVMVLLKPNGTVKSRTWVEFDGSFLFENIPPGAYTLRPDHQGLSERGLRAVPEERKMVFSGGKEPNWFEGVQFKLEKITAK